MKAAHQASFDLSVLENAELALVAGGIQVLPIVDATMRGMAAGAGAAAPVAALATAASAAGIVTAPAAVSGPLILGGGAAVGGISAGYQEYAKQRGQAAQSNASDRLMASASLPAPFNMRFGF